MDNSNLPKTLKLGSTNIYFIETENGFLQIDTSYPECFKTFLAKLKTINIDIAKIRYLFLTHSHNDPAGFASELRTETHCTIIAHKNALESLKQGTIIKVGKFLNRRAAVSMKLYNLSKRRSFEYPPVVLTSQDVTIAGDDETVLKRMGIDGKILYTPGHTDDCISIVLSNVNAFVSDACMSNLGFLHYRPIEVSDLNQVFGSWQKIIDNGAKTIYPAHGKPFPVERLEHYLTVYSPKIKTRIFSRCDNI